MKRISLWGLLLGFILAFAGALAANQAYQPLLEKNPFSPSRKYTPYRAQGEKKNALNLSPEQFKQNIILRGTFLNGQTAQALIQVRSLLKSRLKLKKDRLILKEGDTLGDCRLQKIKRGEIIFGGACEGLSITLSQAPERSKPLPRVPSAQLSPKPAVTKSKPESKKSSPVINPFKALLEKSRKKRK